jgi:transcriptional regulator GlxA family with amidase domain
MSTPSLIELILDALRRHVPASVLPIFRYCLEHAAEPLTVTTVARAHGIHRRALEYRLSDAGLPSPGSLIAWCRLLIAVNQLEHTPKSQEQVGLELGYGTAGALRKAIAPHLKVPGQTLRKPGAFDRAVVRFAETLRSESSRPRRHAIDQHSRRPP